MNAPNPIDQAYRRCRILAALLERYRTSAHSDNNTFWENNGVITPGEKRKDAITKIDRALDELEGLIAHVTILDMAAALEKAAQPRISTAVGLVRKARQTAAKKSQFPTYSDRLIQDSKSFNNLKLLADLLDGHLDADFQHGFKLSRDARNTYAHGTDVLTPPLIDANNAHVFFKKVFEIL